MAPVTEDQRVLSPAAPAARTKAAERQARYRVKHADDYRQHHRDYMRSKRASEKAAPAP